MEDGEVEREKTVDEKEDRRSHNQICNIINNNVYRN
jgi:hypothetical protein